MTLYDVLLVLYGSCGLLPLTDGGRGRVIRRAETAPFLSLAVLCRAPWGTVQHCSPARSAEQASGEVLVFLGGEQAVLCVCARSEGAKMPAQLGRWVQQAQNVGKGSQNHCVLPGFLQPGSQTPFPWAQPCSCSREGQNGARPLPTLAQQSPSLSCVPWVLWHWPALAKGPPGTHNSAGQRNPVAAVC